MNVPTLDAFSVILLSILLYEYFPPIGPCIFNSVRNLSEGELSNKVNGDEKKLY